MTGYDEYNNYYIIGVSLLRMNHSMGDKFGTSLESSGNKMSKNDVIFMLYRTSLIRIYNLTNISYCSYIDMNFDCNIKRYSNKVKFEKIIPKIKSRFEGNINVIWAK
jgi:hypothetical protein